jgi:hypothetical protein
MVMCMKPTVVFFFVCNFACVTNYCFYLLFGQNLLLKPTLTVSLSVVTSEFRTVAIFGRCTTQKWAGEAVFVINCRSVEGE